MAEQVIATVVGPGTVIRGELRCAGDLVVHGRIEGAVSCGGALRLEPGGSIEAEVRARSARIAGRVRGDVSVVEAAELAPSCRLLGDLRAAHVAIAPGAGVRGRIELGDVGQDEDPTWDEMAAPAVVAVAARRSEGAPSPDGEGRSPAGGQAGVAERPGAPVAGAPTAVPAIPEGGAAPVAAAVAGLAASDVASGDGASTGAASADAASADAASADATSLEPASVKAAGDSAVADAPVADATEADAAAALDPTVPNGNIPSAASDPDRGPADVPAAIDEGGAGRLPADLPAPPPMPASALALGVRSAVVLKP